MVNRTRRVLLVVLDSVGIGELPDAADYGDAGAATIQHTADAVGGLKIPNLEALGLGRVAPISGVRAVDTPLGWCGKLAAQSPGKDTTTGHWEMAGIILDKPFSVYPDGFPPEIVDPFVAATGRGILANKAASGTVILEELGAEHLSSGKWILYTSADSVFQLAAHEDLVPIEELYEACRIARELLDEHRVGRVIARPFIGEVGSFTRTYNRHDFSMKPSAPTVLTRLEEAGLPVVGVGKIHDIFAGEGVTRSVSTSGNADGLVKTEELLGDVDQGLIFVNLVDFDMLFGHRRNPEGYARALEAFDAFLPRLQAGLKDDDLLLLTADHGCDPSYIKHTDHTREYVPLLAWSPALERGGDLDTGASFACVAASVAEALGLDWTGPGESIFEKLPLRAIDRD
ncbi:MAG: phosphopentomutase [Deltaproteobacteria bacterium]|nr:phosphopentomutase [Deltaproteobacteria bacterium]